MTVMLDLQLTQTLPDKTYVRRLETCFQKRTSYIPIAQWSHKTYTLPYMQTRGTTAGYSMSNTLHFLVEFKAVALIRQPFFFFNANYMKNLFQNIDTDDILSFLREIKL